MTWLRMQTHAELPMFKSDAMKQRMQRILTYYCKNRGAEYKQGLHEVLAPFILAAVQQQSAQGQRSTDPSASTAHDTAPLGELHEAEENEPFDFSSVTADDAERLLQATPDALLYQMLERMVAKVSLLGMNDLHACWLATH